MHVAKEGLPCVIYATLVSNSRKTSSGIPNQYPDFQDVFEKKNTNTLPEHHSYNYSIDLQDGAQLPFRSIYSLSQNELAKLKEYIEENLAKNFILYSKSSIRAPILFVKKKDRLLQMCVDYRGLNRIIINNRYSLLLIFELLH